MKKQIIGYCRISEDDEKGKVSSSIYSQKQLIAHYALENNLPMPNFYTDNGFSGVDIHRPAFHQVLKLCDEGSVSTVLVKDLSRLGRNYKVMGELEQLFSKNSIRFVAILDNIDSNKSENEFFPFLSVLNELYSRDISKKMLSSKKMLQEQGRYSGTIAPYGYQKSSENKYVLEIEAQGAAVVQKIFDLAASGMRSNTICKLLMAENIPSPFAHFQSMGHSTAPVIDHFYWSPIVVRSILRNPVYIGKLVFGKNSSSRFYPKQRPTPLEQCQIKENTHPPIIDLTLFNCVAEKMAAQKASPNCVVPYFLKGKVRCAFCNKMMYFSSEKKLFNCESKRLRGTDFCPASGLPLKKVMAALEENFAKALCKAQVFTKIGFFQVDKRLRFLFAEKCFEKKQQAVFSAHLCATAISGDILLQLEESSSQYESSKQKYADNTLLCNHLQAFYEKIISYTPDDLEPFVFDRVDFLEVKNDGIAIFYKEVGRIE